MSQKAPEFRLYNSETLQVQPLEKKPGSCLTLYTCGPTTYHYAHIGNFRTYVFEDLLRRALLYFGYQVKQAMNLTDVDDKTIRGAIQAHVPLDVYTQPYKKAFFDDLKALNIQPVEVYPEATSHIDAMIELIQKLLDKKIAYVAQDGSVYFAIDRFKDYGRLAHLDQKQLLSGASHRLDQDEYEKETVSDFVLWKAYDPERDGAIYWESPFGRGRPGWHIECSAMAMQHLGETIDIHVGGIDNLFPHHENEIAQSEACTGKCFVKHWCHSQHLLVDGKKMSKSLGNFYTLRDLLSKGYTGIQVRYALLQAHYRTPLNFTLSGLDAAKNSIERLDGCLRNLVEAIPGDQEQITPSQVEVYRKSFDEALANDLNIAECLAVVFLLVKEVNQILSKGLIGPKSRQAALDLFQRFDQVLGVMRFSFAETIPEEIQVAIEKREQARKNKQYQEADQLRKWIESKGYLLEDSPNGPIAKKQ